MIKWLKSFITSLGYKAGWNKACIDFAIDLQANDEYIAKLEATIAEMKKEWFVDKSKIFLVETNGAVKVGDNQITRQELAILKSEVETFRNFSYWKIIEETIKQKAIEKSVISSNIASIEDRNLELLAGKMMIHNLGIIKSIGDIIVNCGK